MEHLGPHLTSGIPFVFVEEVVKGDRILCFAQNVVVLIRLSRREQLCILKLKLKMPSFARLHLHPATLPELQVLCLRLGDLVWDCSIRKTPLQQLLSINVA